tara:strand:- start:2728 stop:2985 length:258 start_codon:yes stop_codon:yes gene_type:complete
MNWIKKIWKRCTALIVPENRDDCVNLFKALCVEAGVSTKDLRNGKVLELFADWYTGPCDKESILKCIPQFKKENAVANAKLGAKL